MLLKMNEPVVFVWGGKNPKKPEFFLYIKKLFKFFKNFFTNHITLKILNQNPLWDRGVCLSWYEAALRAADKHTPRLTKPNPKKKEGNGMGVRRWTAWRSTHFSVTPSYFYWGDSFIVNYSCGAVLSLPCWPFRLLPPHPNIWNHQRVTAFYPLDLWCIRRHSP